MALRHSPLDAEHRGLGAKMVPFGGWEMPLSYDDGTLAEHRACRDGAVVFDVSHLGTVRVEGPEAFDDLQRGLTNDLRKVAPGRAQYTHLLDDADASVLDDIIVWWLRDGEFSVMPNASNTARRASLTSFQATSTLLKSSHWTAGGTTTSGRPACMTRSLGSPATQGSTTASARAPTTMMSAALACCMT